MNAARAIIQTLIDFGEPIPAARVAAATKICNRIINRTLSRLLLKKRISRVKNPGEYSRYYVSAAQEDQFLRMITGGFRMEISAADAAARLRFLKDLRDRTVYKDSVTLAAIIKDYESALKAAANREKGES